MAVQSSPVLPQTPKLTLTQLTTTATVGTFTTAYTGGTNGSKITGIFVACNSTTAIGVRVALQSSAGTNMNMNAVVPTTGAGFDGTNPPITFMSGNFMPIDGDGNPYLFLTSSTQLLTVTLGSSIPTTNGFINLFVIGSDF